MPPTAPLEPSPTEPVPPDLAFGSEAAVRACAAELADLAKRYQALGVRIRPEIELIEGSVYRARISIQPA